MGEVTRQSCGLWREAGTFISTHWMHFLLLLPALIGVTVVHEAAHAVAVLGQGGVVPEFRCWPLAGHWGQIRYSFPAGAQYAATAISLAPYALWLALCALTALVALRRQARPFWLASTLFFWCLLVPLADVANTLVPSSVSH